jgi:hypothetical protein
MIAWKLHISVHEQQFFTGGQKRHELMLKNYTSAFLSIKQRPSGL